MRDDDARADNQDTPTSGQDAGAEARILFAMLSAYLDDPSDFTVEERARLEAYLATTEGAARTAEVRMLAVGLRELPQVEPPRSFRLAPAQVELPQPVVLRETPQWYARYGTTLRWATAAAAMLFVLVLSADLVSQSRSVSDDADSARPTTAASDTGAAAAEPTATAAGASAAEDSEATLAETSQLALEPEAPTEQGAPPPQGTPLPAGTAASTDVARNELAPTPAATPGEEGATGGAATMAPSSAEPTPTVATTPTPEQAMLAETAEADATAQDEALVASDTSESEAPSRSGWRVAEFSILVVFVVLLALLVILPRWGSRRA